MPRRNSFTVDAEEVQGEQGAEITFRSLEVGTWAEYRETTMTDRELLQRQVISWSGIVDATGKPFPSPDDDPSVLDRLYLHEQAAIARLLFQGPDGTSAKN
jgi:hypothetical protein